MVYGFNDEDFHVLTTLHFTPALFSVCACSPEVNGCLPVREGIYYNFVYFFFIRILELDDRLALLKKKRPQAYSFCCVISHKHKIVDREG